MDLNPTESTTFQTTGGPTRVSARPSNHPRASGNKLQTRHQSSCGNNGKGCCSCSPSRWGWPRAAATPTPTPTRPSTTAPASLAPPSPAAAVADDWPRLPRLPRRRLRPPWRCPQAPAGMTTTWAPRPPTSATPGAAARGGAGGSSMRGRRGCGRQRRRRRLVRLWVVWGVVWGARMMLKCPFSRRVWRVDGVWWALEC